MGDGAALPGAEPGGLTILRALEGRRLAKSYTLGASGRVEARPYDDNAKFFRVELHQVEDIEGLHRAVQALEGDPHAAIIRGVPKPSTNLGSTRRVSRAPQATFTDTPRTWVMLDLDGVEALPPGASILEAPDDAAETVADWLAGKLPELDGVTLVIQFSSSAALAELAEAEEASDLSSRWRGVAKEGVSAHVWVWLTEPRSSAELKRWAEAANAQAGGGKLVDVRLMQPIQLHFTAAPVLAPPLRDPLAGRRTHLVVREADAATLVIPTKAEATAYSGAGGGEPGLGFAGWLERIGVPPYGFHGPTMSAVASYVGATWPHVDTESVISQISAAVRAADPGGRPAAEITRYASEEFLRAQIDWAMAREQEKRAATTPLADLLAEPVATYPDRGVSLAEAQAQGAAAIAAWIGRIQAKEQAPALLVNMTVGAGKTRAGVAAQAPLLEAVREVGRLGPMLYAVPEHRLGAEIQDRIEETHSRLDVRVWRGMEADDPDRPGQTMCRDLALPKAAMRAGMKASSVCKNCAFNPGNGASPEVCGYQAQAWGKPLPQVWVAAHQLMTVHELPEALALPEVDAPISAITIDEDPTLGFAQQEATLAVSALQSEATGKLTGGEREMLLHYRREALAILNNHPPGRLLRDPFRDAFGFDLGGGDFSVWPALNVWLGLERDAQPSVKIGRNTNRDDVLATLQAVSESYTPHLERLVRFLLLLVTGDDARSVNVELVPDAPLGNGLGTGPVLRMRWAAELAPWAQSAPKLILGATTRPELLRLWVPEFDHVDIEVKAEHQRVRQVVGLEFSRAALLKETRRKDKSSGEDTTLLVLLDHVVDYIIVRMMEFPGGVLVVVQKAIESLLQERVRERLGYFPNRLELAHFGAVAGRDKWRGVDLEIIVGRQALNLEEGERLAEIAKGRAVERVQDRQQNFFPRRLGGSRMTGGSVHQITHAYHPDPLVEAVRWTISEGGVIQGVGRPRGVQPRATPVQIDILNSMPLPLTVNEVLQWHDAVPDRLAVAAAEAAFQDRALPLAPADLSAMRPDLWETASAAKHDLQRSKRPIPFIRSPYKADGPFRPARYRKPGARRWSMALVPPQGGRAALEREVGELDRFEFQDEAGAEGVVQQDAAPVSVVVEVAPVPAAVAACGTVTGAGSGGLDHVPVTLPRIRNRLGVAPDVLRRRTRDVERLSAAAGEPLEGEDASWAALTLLVGQEALEAAVRAEAALLMGRGDDGQRNQPC